MRLHHLARHPTLWIGLAGLLGVAAGVRLLSAPDGRTGAGEPPAAAPAPAGEGVLAREDAARPEALAAALGFGALEVAVAREGAPCSGAEVRIYVHAGLEPGTRLPAWRLAGTVTSGPDGVASWPTLPGTYLAAVHAPGLAPAHVVAERPPGERRTRVSVSLRPAVEVAGRVVARRGGEAVPLATVTLAPQRTGREAAPVLPPEELPRATADASGRFRLAAAPGVHLLEATAAGFTRGRIPVTAPQAGVEVPLAASAVVEGFVRRPDGTPAAGAEVTLAGGEELARASAGTSGGFAVEVAPGTYAISARDDRSAGSWPAPVTVAAGERARRVEIVLGQPGAIAGVVTGEDGVPVPGASVIVSPHEAAGEHARASTDAGGRFEAEGLAPGSYDVAVAADGRFAAVRAGLTLLAGERLEVTVVLATSSGLVGTVRDAGGRLVPGALVRATAQPAGAGPIFETRTDAAGAYALRDLEPGPLEVAAIPPGAAAGVPVTVQVTPGSVVRADLVLAETGWLEGLVTRRDRAPVERASVVVVPRLYPAAGGAPVVAEVERGGRYAVQLPAGEYRAFATFVAPAGGDVIRARGPAVRVAPGQTARVDVQVGPETGASALVQVLEPSGQPSPGALVSVTAGDDLRGAGSGTTDEEGFARIDLEERGQLLVRAVRGGRLAGPAALAEQGPTLLVLPGGARLTGRVVAQEGPPSAGFTLEVTAIGDDTAVVSTLAGAAGLKAARGVEAPRRLQFGGDRFEVPDAPSGRVRVAARTPRGRTAHADVDLSPGEERRLELVLPGDGVVMGRVVDARTRTPVAGATVALVVGGRTSARPEATTGPDGRFRIAGLGAGFRKLHLAAPGYAPVEPEADPGGEGGGDLGDVPLTRALDGAAAAR
jgi:hypothetical protein